MYEANQFMVLNQFDVITTSVAETEDEQQPHTVRLYQNYPNPFNPETRIDFDLPQKATVTLAIYDLQGRPIRTLIHTEKAAGHYVAIWDSRTDSGDKAPSGVYVYRLTAGTHVSSKKMVLLK
ncbi:MAG: T9SS type A sorting domain-containing protein [Candidatus Lokiarchaeota archaeon]|nr:T9SS type A sorting domain-containing protein [Candidatus Lokiarchaeota archaeon]